MNYLIKFFGHLKTVCVHKWWVFYYCCHFSIPFRGLIHDMSKFSPSEFFESVKYYSGTRSPIDACKEDNGVSNAWMHHKGRNRHHYEYWQDNFDNGGECVRMPFKENLEMLCDYLGAGRAYMGNTFSYGAELSWWNLKCEKPLAMHPVNKEFITRMLTALKDEPHNEIWRRCPYWFDKAYDTYEDIWENYIIENYAPVDIPKSDWAYGEYFLRGLEEIDKKENLNDTGKTD